MAAVAAGSGAGATQGAADQTATNAASAMQDGLTADYKEQKKGRDAALQLI